MTAFQGMYVSPAKFKLEAYKIVLTLFNIGIISNDIDRVDGLHL